MAAASPPAESGKRPRDPYLGDKIPLVARADFDRKRQRADRARSRLLSPSFFHEVERRYIEPAVSAFLKKYVSRKTAFNKFTARAAISVACARAVEPWAVGAAMDGAGRFSKHVPHRTDAKRAALIREVIEDLSSLHSAATASPVLMLHTIDGAPPIAYGVDRGGEPDHVRAALARAAKHAAFAIVEAYYGLDREAPRLISRGVDEPQRVRQAIADALSDGGRPDWSAVRYPDMRTECARKWMMVQTQEIRDGVRDFRCLDLSGTTFGRGPMDADYSHSNFSRTCFKGHRMMCKARFENCDFSGAMLGGTICHTDSVWDGSSFAGAVINGLFHYVGRASFVNCDFTCTRYTGDRSEGRLLQGAEIARALEQWLDIITDADIGGLSKSAPADAQTGLARVLEH